MKHEEMCNCYAVENSIDGHPIGFHLLPIGDGCGGIVTRELVNNLKQRRNKK